LDLRGLSILADYFLIGSGYAQVQVRALADFVLEAGRAAGAKRMSTEGYEESRWILIDYGDVVIHLMTQESRDYYRLERLWGDAPRVQWETEVNHSGPNPSTDEMEKE
jgi:ribosome-associated protein